jgi:hypothetical protein
MNPPGPPMPPVQPPVFDPHSTFLLNSASQLAKNTNPNINVTPKNGKSTNSISLSNISESDLAKLPFVVNSNNGNSVSSIFNMSVTIPGSNGSHPIPIPIPGFSKTMSQIYNTSDSANSLAGAKTHTPFKQPFNKALVNKQANNYPVPVSVGDFVDQMTSILPNFPSTLGITKTYSMTVAPVVTPTADFTSTGFFGFKF